MVTLIPPEVVTPVKLAVVPNKDAVWVVIPAKVETPVTLSCGVVIVVSVTCIPPAASLTPLGICVLPIPTP